MLILGRPTAPFLILIYCMKRKSYIQDCSFNKDADLGLTMQGLGVDVNEMIETGTVSNDEAEVVYNQLQELSDVGCKVTDDFDMLVVARYLHTQGLSPNGGTGSSQQAGATAPVAE